MAGEFEIDEKRVDALHEKLRREARDAGYNLSPDTDFVKELLRGLLQNEERFGYMSCPCRLASGVREEDLDIVCPCDYRDPDLDDYGACYCALYVSEEIVKGEKQVSSIPERRVPAGAKAEAHEHEYVRVAGLPYPVWRCKVCGYLCAREQPPAVCPICKAKRDRFEKFI